MRTRVFVSAGLLAAALAAPLAAQGNMAGMDMTKKINGSGKLPAGWMNRFDEKGHALTEVDVQQMGNAIHFVSGPAAIYYNPSQTAKGEYSVSATFAQTKSSTHEAYGLFIGGSNLDGPNQNYLYFLVRPIDGKILISHRSSDAAPKALVAMSRDAAPEAAVNTDAPGTGAASNVIGIHVAKDTVHFFVNGKLVRAIAKSQLDGASTDGIVGLRVNHNLDITVEGFAVKK